MTRPPGRIDAPVCCCAGRMPAGAEYDCPRPTRHETANIRKTREKRCLVGTFLHHTPLQGCEDVRPRRKIRTEKEQGIPRCGHRKVHIATVSTADILGISRTLTVYPY